MGHKGLDFFLSHELPVPMAALQQPYRITHIIYHFYGSKHTAVWAPQPFAQHRFCTWSVFCAVFRWLQGLRPDGTTWCFPMDSTQHRIEFHQTSAMLDLKLFSHKTCQRSSSIFVKVLEYTVYAAFLLLAYIPNVNNFLPLIPSKTSLLINLSLVVEIIFTVQGFFFSLRGNWCAVMKTPLYISVK